MTINRAVQRLRALLARAVEWKVLERHPFSGLKPLRHDKSGRVRYLSADEETLLREALLGRELLGHADITMVLRYAHMSPDRLAMAVERVARAAEPAPNPPTPQPPVSGADGASPTPP